MTRVEKCWVFIWEKVWLENTPTFLSPIHFSYLSVYEHGTECSEMSEYKIQTPGNYREESIQHSEHGESLKSSYVVCFMHFLDCFTLEGGEDNFFQTSAN